VSLFIPSIDYYQQVWMRNHLKSLANVRGVSVCVSVFPGWQFMTVWAPECDTRTPNKQLAAAAAVVWLHPCTAAVQQHAQPGFSFERKI
jgi:hypothetical protein